MSFLDRFRRKKEDPEIARRSLLLRAGRIGEATVQGTETDDEGNVMLSYNYTIGGVDYQAFQRLDDQQLVRQYDYLPGARVPLRYDPRRPANSFVVLFVSSQLSVVVVHIRWPRPASITDRAE